LAAEAVFIGVTWLMLDINTSAWIHNLTARLVPISRQAAASGDWSRADEILDSKNTALRESYAQRLSKLSLRFPNNEGEVYIVVVDHGHSYELYPSDSSPEDVGMAPSWELEAYSTGKSTYTPEPFSDNGGTYVGAFTPIVHEGRVVGLMAAELDSATLSQFQEIVRRAFLLSILPAVLASLVISYVLACMFVDPMDVFRAVEESAKGQRSQQSGSVDHWDTLTSREKELAELVRQGLTNPQIADKLSLSVDTVKTHLKNIHTKTGLGKLQLAVAAQARREMSAPEGDHTAGPS
jgi:DNA-binding NarL/FixJ family response regulator